MIHIKTSLLLVSLLLLNTSCGVDLAKENKKIKNELAETRRKLEEKEQEKNNEILKNKKLLRDVELAKQALDSKSSETADYLNREIESTKQALATKDQEVDSLKSDVESTKQALVTKETQVEKMQKALPKVLSKNQETLNKFLVEFLTLSGKINRGIKLTTLEDDRLNVLRDFFADLSDLVQADFDKEVA